MVFLFLRQPTPQLFLSHELIGAVPPRLAGAAGLLLLPDFSASPNLSFEMYSPGPLTPVAGKQR